DLRELHEQLRAERLERLRIEGLAAFVVAHDDADVVEHGGHDTLLACGSRSPRCPRKTKLCPDARSACRYRLDTSCSTHLSLRPSPRVSSARCSASAASGARSESSGSSPAS